MWKGSKRENGARLQMNDYIPNFVHVPCDCSKCVKNEAVLERLKKLMFSDTDGLMVWYLEDLVKHYTNNKEPTYKIDQLIGFLNQVRELQKILGEGK